MSSIIEEYKKTVAGSLIIFFGYLVGTSLDFLVRVVPARLLDVDQYGLFVLAISLLNICSIIGMIGLRYGVTRNLATSQNKQRLFMTALLVGLFTSVTVAIALVAGRNPLSKYIVGTENTPIIYIIALTIPFAIVQGVIVAGFHGLEDAKNKTILRNIVQRVAVFGFVVMGILLGYSSLGAVAGWSLGIILSCGFGLLFLRYKTDLLSISSWSEITVQSAQTLIVFSLPLMIADSIWRVIKEIDKILIGFFLESQSVGIYDSAFTLSKASMVFLWTFMFMFLPQFSRMYNDGNITEMNQFFQTVTKWVTAFGLPALLVLILYPEVAISAVFGEEYAGGAITLIILTLGYTSYIVLGLSKQALTAVGSVRFIMVASLLVLFLNTVLNVGLIPRLGIEGAALATSFSFLISNLLFVYYLYYRENVHPISKKLVALIILSPGIILVLFTYLIPFEPSNLPHLAGIGIVVYILQGVIIYLIGLTEFEQKLIKQFRMKFQKLISFQK